MLEIIIIFAAVAVLFFLCCCLLPPLFKRRAPNNMPLESACQNCGRICVIDDNEAALLWRLRLIESAKREVILVTFDFRDDETGQYIMAALLTAAKRGVKVRVLMDGADGQLCLFRSENFKILTAREGIEVKYYNPIQLTSLWKINYRLHEKYLIIDDTAYLLGGRNVQNAYLSDDAPAAYHDRDVLVYETDPGERTSLAQLRAYFETVWTQKECRLLTGNPYEVNEHFLTWRWAALRDRYGQQLYEFDWYGETMETNGVTLLLGSPAAGQKAPLLWKRLCQIMAQAKREVVIQTPFVLCDQEMLTDLTRLCDRVNTVRLLTNTVENSVNPLGADYANQRKHLLKTGVRLYEYAGEKPMHTKTILIDDSLTLIGSFNLDNRSAYLDTEVMLLIDCPQLNKELKEQIEQLQQKSQQVVPDGTIIFGEQFTFTQLSPRKQAQYSLLRILLRPFQYLL